MSMGQLSDICKVCANRCVIYSCARQLRCWTICDPYHIQHYDLLLIYLTLGYRCVACLLFPIETPIPASIVTWSSSCLRCHLKCGGVGWRKRAKIIVKREIAHWRDLYGKPFENYTYKKHRKSASQIIETHWLDSIKESFILDGCP